MIVNVFGKTSWRIEPGRKKQFCQNNTAQIHARKNKKNNFQSHMPVGSPFWAKEGATHQSVVLRVRQRYIFYLEPHASICGRNFSSAKLMEGPRSTNLEDEMSWGGPIRQQPPKNQFNKGRTQRYARRLAMYMSNFRCSRFRLDHVSYWGQT